MKKILGIVLALSLTIGCQKKEENDNDALVALALSQLNRLPTECNVTVSVGAATYNIPNVPITYTSPTAAQVVRKIDVLDSNGNKVNHVIGAISLTANAGTTLTLTGGHYVILYEKGAGCPIGNADDRGNITTNADFTLTGITRAGSNNLAAAAATIRFNRAGRYFYIVYQGPFGTNINTEVSVITSAQ